ncbi:MAG: DMT family transporter [Burkholderiales bacterium]|jgi:drug/metabolite transporter (DMT)-like permease|nr:DMT family transporter [Burkholderiales bacterium]
MTQTTDRRAILTMLCALGVLILLDASGKWLGMAGFPVAAITWSRYLGHLLLVLALFVPTSGLRVLHTQSPGRQLLRGALMVTVSLLYFAAVRYLPLAQATAVFFTTPMLVTLFATVFLKERPGWATWLALAGGFLGVMIVVRPGASLPLVPTLLVFGAAACNAAYQTLTRAQSQADPPEVQVLYAGLVGAALMTVSLPLWWTPGWWMDPGFRTIDWIVFALLGVLGATGHLLLARAFRLALASRLSPWGYMQILLSICVGWLAFGDAPDAIALVGMALIALCPQLVRLQRQSA